MIISISGYPGSGKSTVAEMLAKKLDYKRYYMGGIMRQIAKDRGITIEELNELCKYDDSVDREVDEYQQKLGLEEDNFVIEGRTSYYFIPHSVKLFIDIDPMVAANRVFNSSAFEKKNRNEKNYSSVEELSVAMIKRIEIDSGRYREYYGIENSYDLENFDFIVDSGNLTPDEVVQKIIDYIKKLN